MRVLFIKQDPSYAEPLGLMQLSAALKAAGHETKLIFAYQPDLLAKVQAYRPGVIAYSSTTGVHRTYAAINRWLKRCAGFPFFAAFGGPHVTYFPEFLEQNPEVDGICRGEGDEALPELVANLAAAKTAGVPVAMTRKEDLDALAAEFAGADLLLDALLGVSSVGKPTGPVHRVIQLMNKSARPIVAVDIPSGLSPDTGHHSGVFIIAKLTLTLGFAKSGLMAAHAQKNTGVIRVLPIGYPQALIDEARR